jgi:hypothetical protein
MDREITRSRLPRALAILLMLSTVMYASTTFAAQVNPGVLITPENAPLVTDLVSPGNFILVRQGMRMKIVPTQRLEWPPPYKAATEKYSPQVRLNDRGELQNYVAGLPFPLLDANDPQVATKVMWNFSYRPQFTDDFDVHRVEIESNRSGRVMGGPIEHFTIGRIAFYNNVGRTEVEPIPTDPEANTAGIRYRFAAFPFLEPSELQGCGLLRYRNKDPKLDDYAWLYAPTGDFGFFRWVKTTQLSDAIGGPLIVLAQNVEGPATYANNIDPDSYFGFAAKIENYNYKLLGIKPMLACTHADNLPAKPCQFDNHRTVCPEAWEMRLLYVIEATAKPQSQTQKLGSDGVLIPKRILYIDSEGWFVTASDQYDRRGDLWKTLATFNAYRDRTGSDAKLVVYPWRRMLQTAMVDEDIQNGCSSVMYTPGPESGGSEGWRVNTGTISKDLLDIYQLDWRSMEDP